MSQLTYDMSYYLEVMSFFFVRNNIIMINKQITFLIIFRSLFKKVI